MTVNSGRIARLKRGKEEGCREEEREEETRLRVPYTVKELPNTVKEISPYYTVGKKKEKKKQDYQKEIILLYPVCIIK